MKRVKNHDDEVNPSSSESESLSESENPSSSSLSESDSSSHHESENEEPSQDLQVEVYDGIVIERKRARPISPPIVDLAVVLAPPEARARGRRPPPIPVPNLAAAIAPPRRQLPARRAAEGLREAFMRLVKDDLEGFLDCPIIREKLRPAFVLLKGEFQSGYGQERITTYWKMYWYNDLYVRSLGNYRVRGQCIACKKSRCLKYAFNQIGKRDIDYYGHLDDDIDGDGFIGLMGCDCFEVKFQPLMQLVDKCLEITDILESDPDQVGFDDLVYSRLGSVLNKLNCAGALMKQRNNRHD